MDSKLASATLPLPAPAPGGAIVARPGKLALDFAVVKVLWKRDLVRFFRQRSRVIGALVQPLIFWVVIGSGFSRSFKMPGAEGVGYLQYFFPGIVLMVILFTSIFSTMSLIEDRHEGFLQAVLAAPGSRAALVLGKTLGGASIALVQVLAILLLAPFAGFAYGSIAWASLLAMLVFTSIGLTALGFVVAWWLDSVQGYHAVMSVLLIPAWIVSGSMFPIAGGPGWMQVMVRLNPLSYAASGVRRAMSGPNLPAALAGGSFAIELGVVLVMALVALALATYVCKKRPA
ncbi:MAG: ABC transporter permease [Polyangiales bacterium]